MNLVLFRIQKTIAGSCDKKAIELSGLISQYILPLKRLDGSVLGTLQIDLGDSSQQSPEAFLMSEKAKILDCFAEVISASINQVTSAVENAIMLSAGKVPGRWPNGKQPS